MTTPSVCCTMLVADRQEMGERAERAFLRQSYRNSTLLILDSGDISYEPTEGLYPRKMPYLTSKKSVGALRNEACEIAAKNGFDIIAHMDSDDVSYPNRLTEQVAALLELRTKAPEVEVIGSSEMMFWRSDRAVPWETVHCACGNVYPRSGAPCSVCHQYPAGESWRYRDELHTPVCGSLCYWVDAWKRQPFADCMVGESKVFLQANPHLGFTRRDWVVATIHGSNTNNYAHSLSIDDPHSTARFWREPGMDETIGKLMEGA